jgi:hypothetical protein
MRHEVAPAYGGLLGYYVAHQRRRRGDVGRGKREARAALRGDAMRPALTVASSLTPHLP